MKRSFLAVLALVALILVPVLAGVQAGQMPATNPPIAQPLVHEGDFAVKLVEALQLGTAANETEAESVLGSAGVAPRNGWIADYPVTPDIMGELQKAVSDAADSRRLSMGKHEALEAFRSVGGEFNLSVTPYSPDQVVENPEGYEDYANPAAINDYYSSEGPPVVTYYVPPLDYYYLYSWVPYPFWWSGFWFPGFFCQTNFHKVVIVDRRAEVISNHFVDHRTNKVLRIDPVRRFNGSTFAGIGVQSRIKGLVSPGVRGGAPKIFSGSRERAISGSGVNPGGTVVPRSGSRPSGSSAGGGRTMAPRSGSGGFGGGGQRR